MSKCFMCDRVIQEVCVGRGGVRVYEYSKPIKVFNVTVCSQRCAEDYKSARKAKIAYNRERRGVKG